MRYIRNICLVDTPYALSVYLLKMSMDDILHTKFITSGSLSPCIITHLPNGCISYWNYEPIASWKQLVKVRIDRLIKYPYLFSSNLYAQDHLALSAQIIGRKNYTMIPDSPNCFETWEGSPLQPHDYPMCNNWIKRIKNWLSYQDTMYNHMYGTNNQCINRWVINKSDAKTKYLKNRSFEYVNPQQLWQNADDEKREFILQVYEIDFNLLNNLKDADTLILTQPLREDCGLSDDEYQQIFEPYICKNPNVIIKPHPRDKFDFEKYFPNTLVLKSYVPMQLINYMGIVPRRAITVCSSAISAIPDYVEKITLGTKVNTKIFNKYGDLYN